MTFNTANLADALPDALVVIDGSGVLCHANSATVRIFGWSFEDKVGTSAFDLIHPDDVDLALLSLVSVVDKEVGTPIELRIRSESGWRLVEVVGAPYQSPDIDGGVILVLRDLTDRRRWEVAGDDDNRFRALLQNGAALTCLVSADGIVQSVSGAVARQLGHDHEDVIDDALALLVDEDDREIIGATLDLAHRRRNLSATERHVSCEVQMLHKAGHTVPFQLSIVDLVDDPTVEGFVVTGHDVTELHEARDMLAHTASHDALTGLPNRDALRDHLRERLDASEGSPLIAVCFVDLDRFKPVNDIFGHDAGDELLVAVAGRLQRATRVGDIVARLGGDEFVIVAAVTGLGEALKMAERLEDSIARPFGLSCGPVQVYASIGVAVADKDSTVESLLTDADAAMYSVKHGRRGTPQNSRRSVSERRALAEGLNRAFEEAQFVVHYQPIVDMAVQRTIGHEALVRWEHPEKGLLLPGQFLDVVEELGHEADIGEVVLRQALHDLAIIDEATGVETSMSVNAAAAQLTDSKFPPLVAAMLAEAHIPPSRLTIEVSERTILERSTHGPSTPVMSGLQTLKNLGVRIAADDFGTGYSSLTHLVSYPIDSLKIDRSFISGVLTDESRRAIVLGLIALAKGMRLVVVAEGVEEVAQSRILRESGCELAQGYLYGRPMPIEQVVAHRIPML